MAASLEDEIYRLLDELSPEEFRKYFAPRQLIAAQVLFYKERRLLLKLRNLFEECGIVARFEWPGNGILPSTIDPGMSSFFDNFCADVLTIHFGSADDIAEGSIFHFFTSLERAGLNHRTIETLWREPDLRYYGIKYLGYDPKLRKYPDDT